MNQYLEIPYRLPGLNEVVEANRQNRFAGANLKKVTDELIRGCILEAGIKPVKYPCVVHMTFCEPNRRRDVDNVESAKKFILDALVRSGILLGDSPKYVLGAPSWTRFDLGGGNHVRVTIIEDEREDDLRARLLRAEVAVTGGDANDR